MDNYRLSFWNNPNGQAGLAGVFDLIVIVYQVTVGSGGSKVLVFSRCAVFPTTFTLPAAEHHTIGGQYSMPSYELDKSTNGVWIIVQES